MELDKKHIKLVISVEIISKGKGRKVLVFFYEAIIGALFLRVQNYALPQKKNVT